MYHVFGFDAWGDETPMDAYLGSFPTLEAAENAALASGTDYFQIAMDMPDGLYLFSTPHPPWDSRGSTLEKTMDHVYVVSYSTGEWSERCDWPAAWYPTEAEAQAHVDRFVSLRHAALEPLGASRMYDMVPVTDALRAFVAFIDAEWALKDTVYLREVATYNTPGVTKVPRGTLSLHGLTETP